MKPVCVYCGKPTRRFFILAAGTRLPIRAHILCPAPGNRWHNFRHNFRFYVR